MPVGEDPKGRAKAMLAICETMKHMETLRLLARREWISVDELSKRSGFSRRVVYRVVKDLVASGLVEMRVESGRRQKMSFARGNQKCLILTSREKMKRE